MLSVGRDLSDESDPPIVELDQALVLAIGFCLAISGLLCAHVAYNVYIRKDYKIWGVLRKAFWNDGMTLASVVLTVGVAWLAIVCTLSVRRERRLRPLTLQQEASPSTEAAKPNPALQGTRDEAARP